MKLYAYCLLEDRDAFDATTRGISGGEVQLLQVEEFAVLVSKFDGETVAVTRENALDHAAVVRSVLDQTTPLPFRFGTLVAEQQLRSYIAARKPALQSRFAHVRGGVEMSVKIIRQVSAAQATAKSSEIISGTTFLEVKRREILGSEQNVAEAREISTWLHEQVESVIGDEQVTVRPSEKLVLAAAHLVDRDKIPQYKEFMTKARESRPELHFLLSGPWPPYSFANIELEFKSQFGVS